MELNDLLRCKGFDPQDVLVLRHRPTEPKLRKVLPLLAADKPDWFNAYQQTQTLNVETAMTKAKYVASFIGHDPGSAVYVGLYKIGKQIALSYSQYWKVPAYVAMRDNWEMVGAKNPGRTYLWFDLDITNFYSEWKGKLIIDWPPPERAWWRRAHKNKMRVHAVLEDTALEPSMKLWDEVDFTWGELDILPKRWQAKLSEWRGIYYIFDTYDAKGYVGAAYGAENLFGRWRNYASSGHGGNRLLRKRNPNSFRFTILELVSPNMLPDQVIALEKSWKERLHTRQPFGLNIN